MKTKKPKKHYPTDIPLAENVRLLKCGAWGYIHKEKAIFKSVNVETVNSFAKWVKHGCSSALFETRFRWTNEEI